MKNNIDKIIESAKQVSLSKDEKVLMREKISKYIDSTPLPSPFVMKEKVGRLSEYNNIKLFNLFTLKQTYIMPIVLFILLSLGAGTSVAAQGSLPGDVLYPIKIHLNENIEGFATISSKGDAEVALKQAIRRLEEAESLEARGSLSEERALEIRGNFSREVESMNKRLAKIAEKGDSKSRDEVNDRFEKEIDDHFRTFIIITGDGTTTTPFADIIRVRKERSDDKNDKEDNLKRANEKSGARLIDDKDNNRGGTSDDSDDSDDDSSDDSLDDLNDDRGGNSGRDDEDNDNDEDEDEDSGKDLPVIVLPVATSTATSTTGTTVAKFTLTQVAQHNVSTNCWAVVGGVVYNLTSWISQHPGGAVAIIGLCGTDATVAFTAQHGGQGNPARELAGFKIGVVQ